MGCREGERSQQMHPAAAAAEDLQKILLKSALAAMPGVQQTHPPTVRACHHPPTWSYSTPARLPSARAHSGRWLTTARNSASASVRRPWDRAGQRVGSRQCQQNEQQKVHSRRLTTAGSCPSAMTLCLRCTATSCLCSAPLTSSRRLTPSPVRASTLLGCSRIASCRHKTMREQLRFDGRSGPHQQLVCRF